ncbi:aminotransferase GliI-like protein [Penicillium hispanicum]|uniref:aminotransferase GliI-like protein n=1 Tax=Penicillium hispanicum TaxID=1080232 RepID=UPI002540EF71|nr:aminotransferase GliI-like protein [Penicillium hispanicum]KAJ5578059.1 aminotransferase GliI-like protein [Penicillium hispanicum]
MESALSSRGNANLTEVLPLFPPYLLNPDFTWDGVDLTLAENQLIRGEILSILKTSVAENVQPQHLDWPKGLCGHPKLLDALAKTFNRYFHPYAPIEQEHIAVMPGTAAGLDSLLYHLCDPGDGVLVPCPYWSGYDTYFAVRSQVRPIGVEISSLEESLGSTLISALESQYQQAPCPIKAVVLSNPHNPLGRPYPPAVLEQCMAFCQERNLHLIADEVFALTGFTSPDLPDWPPFASILSLDPARARCSADRVHVLWSVSKDLAASGVRLGCIATRNAALRSALGLASSVNVSALSGVFVADLLTSPQLPSLLDLSRVRLAERYAVLTTAFRRIGIAYVPCSSAVFLMARLAPRATTVDEEVQACGQYRAGGVAVVPGKAYHMPKDQRGWMRVTFGVETEELERGIHCIELVYRQLC